MDVAERKSLGVSVAVAAIAFILIVGIFSYIISVGEFHHLAVENPERIPLPRAIPAEDLSEIWFSPSGRLFATFQRGRVLFLASWDPVRDSWQSRPMYVFDFSALTGVHKPEFLMNSFHGGVSGDEPIPVSRSLAYSISDDGTKIAWAWNGQLFWGSTEEPAKFLPKVKGQYLPSAPPIITSVSIIGSDRVAIIANGLWTWSPNDRKVNYFNLNPELRLAWSRGKSRIIASEADVNPIMVSWPRGKLSWQKFPGVLGGSCFATSLAGEGVAGTAEGMIIALKGLGPSAIAVLNNNKRVRALAIYKMEWIVAGGEGPGLFLSRRGSGQVIEVLSTPERVRFLAIDSDHLAYATPHSLVVANFEWKLGLSEGGKWLLAVMFSLIGLLSFARVIIIDVLRLWYPRREEMPSTPKSEAASISESVESNLE